MSFPFFVPKVSFPKKLDDEEGMRVLKRQKLARVPRVCFLPCRFLPPTNCPLPNIQMRSPDGYTIDSHFAESPMHAI